MKKWKLIAGSLFCCALWGSAPPFIKLGYEALKIDSTASILFFAGIRFLCAGVMVTITGSILEKHPLIPTKAMWKPIAILAFFQTFGQYLFYYLGLAQVSGVLGSVLSGTSACFTLLLSAYVFHLEKSSLLKICGCLLSFGGIVVMNLDGFELHFGIGELFMILSQICSAFSAVFLQIFGRRHNSVLLSGWQFMTGGLVLALCGLSGFKSISWNLEGILILFWLAFVSAAAYTLWGLLLRDYPVTSVSIFICMVPVFGVLFSWLILKESQAFSWQSFLSLALICTGIWMLNKKGSAADL